MKSKRETWMHQVDILSRTYHYGLLDEVPENLPTNRVFDRNLTSLAARVEDLEDDDAKSVAKDILDLERPDFEEQSLYREKLEEKGQAMFYSLLKICETITQLDSLNEELNSPELQRYIWDIEAQATQHCEHRISGFTLSRNGILKNNPLAQRFLEESLSKVVFNIDPTCDPMYLMHTSASPCGKYELRIHGGNLFIHRDGECWLIISGTTLKNVGSGEGMDVYSYFNDPLKPTQAELSLFEMTHSGMEYPPIEVINAMRGGLIRCLFI